MELSNFDTLNDWFGEIRCVAKSGPPQLRTNAASATWSKANVGKVRIADLTAQFFAIEPDRNGQMTAMSPLCEFGFPAACARSANNAASA